jgi:hypothetical protein
VSELVLPVPAFNLMLALVHVRGSGTTTDFNAAFKFGTVNTKARELLVEHGMIKVGKIGNSYFYELTDAGWLAARQLLRDPLPAKASPLTARILWAILGDFSTHMDRTGTELADVYPVPAEVEPKVEPESDTVESIRIAYESLAKEPSGWVPLLRLREELGQVDRTELDATLTELLGSHRIRLIPESNQKTLTEADREAAVSIGGKQHHLIAIETR